MSRAFCTASYGPSRGRPRVVAHPDRVVIFVVPAVSHGGLRFFSLTRTCSGGTRGLCIGHISPEAVDAGVIGLLKDGDKIKIDIENRVLEVELSDEEIEARRKQFKPADRQIPKGYLSRYAKTVSSASRGAVSV